MLDGKALLQEEELAEAKRWIEEQRQELSTLEQEYIYAVFSLANRLTSSIGCQFMELHRR